MAVTTNLINKPLNPRGQDQSPKGYNRAALYSGKALDFDGANDLITITDSASVSSEFQSIGNNDSYTLCAYFKTTDTTSHNGWIASANQIMELRQEVAAGKSPFSFGVNGGKLTFGRNDTANSTNNVYKNSGSVDVATGHYFFGVAVVDNDNVKLYVNGALDLNDTITTSTGDCSVSTTTSNFVLGCRSLDSGSFGNYFDGEISSARLFSTALTAAQVADLYNNPEKIVPTGVSNDALKLWLPMMEGAGTTAYDGSGNGNHGTISGATWTHGVGSPVAQTAVIDWNKGRNMTHYSEDGTQWTTGGNAPTITQDQADPFGGTRAQRITMDASGTFAQVYKGHNQILSGVQYTAKMWLKAVSGTPTIGINYNGSGGTWHQVTLTNEWAEYEVTRTMNADYSSSHNILIGSPAPGTSSTADFYVYGLQIKLGDTAGPYIPTFGTAQTSAVLLPQGLTSGRDITGVNLFENVRKQGALNLDGNSWAEVHDNASLDIGDFSLEAWVKFEKQGDYQVFFAKDDSGTDRSFELFLTDTDNKFGSNIFGQQSNFNTQTINDNQWYHIVATFTNSTNAWVGYVDGAQNKSATISASQNDTDAPVIIGTWYDKTNYFTHGQIAQPRIYNRALTAEEIERNYSAGKNTYKN